MKKKGHHTIPDFSTKRPGPPSVDTQLPKVKPAPLGIAKGGKPHSTSKKSGHRGS
jgi:hypothetical protein